MLSRRESLAESRTNASHCRASNRSGDIQAIRVKLRGSSLEGRRPRRLATTRDINHIETFVPAAGGAAGPPIDTEIIMRFA